MLRCCWRAGRARLRRCPDAIRPCRSAATGRAPAARGPRAAPARGEALRAESPAALAKLLESLEERMYRHAENLEFEDAARLRDEIEQLREQALRQPAASAR